MNRSKEDLPDYVTERIGPYHSPMAIFATDGGLMLLTILATLALCTPQYDTRPSLPAKAQAADHQRPTYQGIDTVDPGSTTRRKRHPDHLEYAAARVVTGAGAASSL